MEAVFVLLMIGWTYAGMAFDPPSMAAPVLQAESAYAPKCWVWLTSQRCWGWGYKRPDGYWVIDRGSKWYPQIR